MVEQGCPTLLLEGHRPEAFSFNPDQSVKSLPDYIKHYIWLHKLQYVIV